MELSGQLHTPGRFTPGERTTSSYCIGGWVGPSASLCQLIYLTSRIQLRTENPVMHYENNLPPCIYKWGFTASSGSHRSNLLSNGCRGPFPWGWGGRDSKSTTHLHPVPRSRSAWSCASTPPMRLRGVVLKKRTGTTLPYLPSLLSNGYQGPFPWG